MVNDVRATLSKSQERINVLEGSQETTSRNFETLKTDLHDAVKKSNKNSYLGLIHTTHQRKKSAPHCRGLFSTKAPNNSCLVHRRVSLDNPMVPCGSSLAFLYLAKNEAPEEELEAVKVVRDIL